MHRLVSTGMRLLGFAAALGIAPGCVIVHTIRNRDAAWAFNEPAPMSVIVRRAEVARGVTEQVQRLLDEPPALGTVQEGLALSPERAAVVLGSMGTDPVYMGQPLRVVPAEAWLEAMSHVCPVGPSAPTLMAALGPDVLTEYQRVSALNEQIATLRENLGSARARARKAKGDDKRALRAEISRSKADIDVAEAEFEPALQRLTAAIGRSETVADDPALAATVVRLRESLDDARIANAAALIRYPLAAPNLSDDLQAAAKRFFADVIEEQTGQRPSTDGLSPAVRLEAGEIKLSMNGVDAAALGSLRIDAVITDTASRMKDYVARVLTLPAYVARTQKRLEFQRQVLDALATRLGPPGEPSPDITALTIQARAGTDFQAYRQGARSLGGLAYAACPPPVEPTPPAEKKAKSKKKKKRRRGSASKDRRVARSASP